MIVTYFSVYLLFIMLVSLAVGWVALKFKLSAPRVVVPLIIAVIVLPGLLGFFYVTYFSSIPEVVVPDLRGRPLESALAELEVMGLKGRQAGSVFDTNIPEGGVAQQRPEAGRVVKGGRTISLLISSGKNKVAVPNLLGRELSQAEEVVRASGLVLGGVSRDYLPGSDPDVILAQDPVPGEQVDVNSPVSLTVSSTLESDKTEQYPRKMEREQGGLKFPWW